MISVISSLALLSDVLAVDMPLNGINGERVNLNHYQGRWVVVNYWATWCPPCIEEMPELQAFHNNHVEKDALVVGINSELINPKQLKSFLDNYFISYPVFISKPAQQSELGLIPGLPTTFLVSPQGKVVARQVGPVTRDMLEQFMVKWKAP
jgi:thiol-disulfide isomerase/thioredoxin